MLQQDKGGLFHEGWLRFFRSWLNAKSDVLDPDITKKLPQEPVASMLGTEPTEQEVTTAVKEMENAKTAGLDGLPVELLQLGPQQDRTILMELHRLFTLIWCEGEVS